MFMSSFFPLTHCVSATFTAAEVDRITGVRPHAQRDWRRRGLFRPADDGWMRYSVDELAQIALRQTLSILGLPHLSEMLVFDEVVPVVMGWARTHPTALEIDPRIPETIRFSPATPDRRFCLAVLLPDPEASAEVEFRLFAEASEIQAHLDAQEKQSAALHIVDCKALGLSLAGRSEGPLWTQLPGPSREDITDAMNSAARGDEAAQVALMSIGLDWRVPE